MKILQAIFNFFCEIVLGCSHQHLTRPFTLQKQTYMVCLDCGKQIYYSAASMRPLTMSEVRHLRGAHAGEMRIMPASVGVSASGLVPASARKSNAA
jgi:hypothetical protein